MRREEFVQSFAAAVEASLLLAELLDLSLEDRRLGIGRLVRKRLLGANTVLKSVGDRAMAIFDSFSGSLDVYVKGLGRVVLRFADPTYLAGLIPFARRPRWLRALMERAVELLRPYATGSEEERDLLELMSAIARLMALAEEAPADPQPSSTALEIARRTIESGRLATLGAPGEVLWPWPYIRIDVPIELEKPRILLIPPIVARLISVGLRSMTIPPVFLALVVAHGSGERSALLSPVVAWGDTSVLEALGYRRYIKPKPRRVARFARELKDIVARLRRLNHAVKKLHAISKLESLATGEEMEMGEES